MKLLSKILSSTLLLLLATSLQFSSQAQGVRKDTVPAQPPVFKKSDQKGNQSGAPQTTGDALKQKAEQIKGEQKAVREQRRQERIREWQEQSVGNRVLQPPPIYGQTPLQQQQMALRDQKRQLQWQQQQAQRAQQLKFERQQAEKARQQAQQHKPGQ